MRRPAWLAPHAGRRVAGRPLPLPPSVLPPAPVSDLEIQGGRRELARFPSEELLDRMDHEVLCQLAADMRDVARLLDKALRHCQYREGAR